MKNIKCMVFNHDLKVTKYVTYHVKEYTCKNCQKEYTINGNGNLTPLTPEYREINKVLKRMHLKRIVIKNTDSERKKPSNKNKLRIA